MADNQEKVVLLRVESNLDQTVNAMAEYQVAIDEINEKLSEYQAKQKKGEKLSAEERAEMVKLKEERKAYSKEMGELSRKVQNTLVANNKYKDTLKGLCAELSKQKDILRSMPLGTEEYDKQSEAVNALNQRIKDLEGAYGVHVRNVGDYEGAVLRASDRIRQLVQDMNNMRQAGQEGSEEFEKASAELNGFADTATRTGHDSLDAANNGLGAMVGAMMVFSQIAGEDSEQAKKMNELMQKLNVAVVALSAVMRIYQALEKKGIVQKIAHNLQVKAAVKNIAAEAAAETAGTVAKKASTKAQLSLNAAMEANPIGIIVAAVAALVAGLVALVSWLFKSTAAQKAANAAAKEYEKVQKDNAVAITILNAEEAKRSLEISARHQKRIKELMEQGATEEEITKAEQALQAELAQNTIAAANERIKANKSELKSMAANLKTQQALLAEMTARRGADAKKTKEQADKVRELRKAYADLAATINSDIKTVNDTTFAQAQTAYNNTKIATDKAFDEASKHYDSMAKLQTEALKRTQSYYYDVTKSEQENGEAQFQYDLNWAAQEFALKQQQEKNKLALQRKYRKITQKEYNDALSVLRAEADSFYQAQLEAELDHQQELFKAAVSLAGGKDLDGQLADVKAKYASAEKAIKDDATATAEEKAYYLTQLAKKQAAEERAVRLNYQDQAGKEISEQIRAQYKDDVRAFSNSEVERLDYEIEIQRKIVEARKAAGLSTLEDEAKLNTLLARRREAVAAEQLQIDWRNADARYKTLKDYYEKEIALASEGTALRAQLEQELADVVVENNQRKLESFSNYSSQALEIASSLNDLLNNLGSAQVQKYEKENNSKKDALDKRLKAGLISQKKYDKEVAALDADLDAKKAQIERKQAIRAKALSAMQIAINTAAAIMKIWAEVPKMDFGVSTGVLTALAAATGAIQLAAVLAEPLPTARKGGRIEGPTHEQGGVLVNTEGDERIISANPSRVFPELLNLISYIGKHAGVPDTGYSGRILSGAAAGASSAELDYDLLSAKIGSKVAEAVRDMNIVVAVEDIRRAEQEYARVEQSSRM